MALPKHPANALARRYLAFGSLLAAGSGAAVYAGFPSAAIVGGSFAAMLLWSSVTVRRSGDAVLLNNLAFERLSRGHVSEAEELLARIPARYQTKGALARAVGVQRAMIALYRGDAEAAVAAATAAASRPYDFFARDHQRRQDASAHALRALANASLGRVAEALEDAGRADGTDPTSPEAIARAALARALVVSRTQGASGLAKHFAVGGASKMIEYLSPRERALARALRRMARASRPHAYREAAKADDERAQKANELASWMASIAPAAAAFATEEYASTAEVDARVAATPEGLDAVARSRQKAQKKPAAKAWQVLVLWVVLVALMLFGWSLVPQGHGAHAKANDQPFVFAPGWVLALGTVAIFAITVGLQIHRRQRAQRQMAQARLDLARGNEASAQKTLERLTKSALGSVAGGAWLGIAYLAERKTDFARCLDACDHALNALWRNAAVRAMQSDIALPEIVATRAFALAALGRRTESDAERARLVADYPSYPYAARAHFRVGLIAAVRAGDLEAAARIARTRTPDLPLYLRDELLADVVLAVVEGASPEERERIASELREDAEVRAWVEAVAPGLCDRMHGVVRVATQVEEGADEAESEASALSPSRLRSSQV